MRINAAIVICFSAGNLSQVASMVEGRKYALAANDESGTRERSAKEAALAYCMGDVVGEDANDLRARAGLTAVCQKLMAVRRTVA
jgi:putative DNA primase/helicase